MVYFARMLDKIRKHAAGDLRVDLQKNLGIALDGRCCAYLHVDYSALWQRTLEGGSDAELFEWCQANGRRLTEVECFIWNEYARKIGWNDARSEMLVTYKADSGLTDRPEVQTMFDYMDADEGRTPHNSADR